MFGEAGRDHAWQTEMKNLLLVPLYNKWRDQGLIENWRTPTSLAEEKWGDTFLKFPYKTTAIEEKIVRWPGYPYTAITLETRSCTVEGRERIGWMHSEHYRWLIYARVNEDGISADCDLFFFPHLKKWFFETYAYLEQLGCLWPRWVSEQINQTECYVVPLDEIRQSVWSLQFSVPSEADGLSVIEVLSRYQQAS